MSPRSTWLDSLRRAVLWIACACGFAVVLWLGAALASTPTAAAATPVRVPTRIVDDGPSDSAVKRAVIASEERRDRAAAANRATAAAAAASEQHRENARLTRPAATTIRPVATIQQVATAQPAAPANTPAKLTPQQEAALERAEQRKGALRAAAARAAAAKAAAAKAEQHREDMRLTNRRTAVPPMAGPRELIHLV